VDVARLIRMLVNIAISTDMILQMHGIPPAPVVPALAFVTFFPSRK
jgi:hypothetical protein